MNEFDRLKQIIARLRGGRWLPLGQGADSCEFKAGLYGRSSGGCLWD